MYPRLSQISEMKRLATIVDANFSILDVHSEGIYEFKSFNGNIFNTDLEIDW